MNKIIITKKAFTLIEVLISVSIISLLATVVMYSTSEAKLKGEDAHMKVESDQVAKAIQLYKEDNNGKVPGHNVSYSYKGEMVLENDPNTNKKQAYNDVMSELVPKYLPEIPTSPSGESYGYLVTEDGNNAVFASALNFGSDNNSKNSCDLVDGGVSWGNKRLINMDLMDLQRRCSVALDNNLYNSETEKCFDYISDGINYNNLCEPIYPLSNQWTPLSRSLDLSILPDSMCKAEYDFYSGGYTFFIDGTDYVYIVEYTGSVCSGSSNSDFCSCI